MKIKKLNPKNWFYCGQCECRSYDYECECGGMTCNGGGCEKCDGLYELAREAKKNGTAPSVEELKQKWLNDGFSAVDGNRSAEDRMLKENFDL